MTIAVSFSFRQSTINSNSTGEIRTLNIPGLSRAPLTDWATVPCFKIAIDPWENRTPVAWMKTRCPVH
jgi:hypothetical protein